jgi:microsomal epoxide hydrolase
VLARRYTLDELITTIMIYWVTRTIGSSMRMYYETFLGDEPHPAASPRRGALRHGGVQGDEPSATGTGGAALRHPPWTVIDDGGHFPRSRKSDALAHEIREFFRDLS